MKRHKTHPADNWCHETILKFPESLEISDRVRRDRNLIVGNCPEWCALPTTFVAHLLAGTYDKQAILRALDLPITNELTAALIWTRSKMIYRFDADLEAELTKQSNDHKIPSEIFDYLPYPCVFVEHSAKMYGENTTGYFAWLDWGTVENIRLLRLLFTKQNKKSIAFVFPIVKDTVQECILNMANHYTNSHGNFTKDDIQNCPEVQTVIRCINLLLYLCSEKPDMPDTKELDAKRSRSILGNPKRAAVWDVGTRIGASLRKEAKSDAAKDAENDPPKDGRTRSSKRPHLRRAHWHSFWTGKRDGSERKIVLRWLPPIAVKLNGAELPTVITPVERQ